MSAAKASLAYFVTRGVSGVLAVATVALFARLLGPQGYASLTLAATIAAFVGSVLVQPLHSSLGRFLPGTKDARLTVALGRLLLVGGGLAAALAGLVEWLHLAWLPRGVALAAAALCVAQGVFDFRQLAGGTPDCSQCRHFRLDATAHFDKVQECFNGFLGHSVSVDKGLLLIAGPYKGTAPPAGLQQTICLEPGDRLAHDRAADSEVFGHGDFRR